MSTRMSPRPPRTCLLALLLLAGSPHLARVTLLAPSPPLDSPAPPPATSPGSSSGETPFPGETRFHVSEEETPPRHAPDPSGFLHGRIHLVPLRYTQQQIASVHTDDILEVITGGGGLAGARASPTRMPPVAPSPPRVEQRINFLLGIANRGSAPSSRFARLLNFAQNLARATCPTASSGSGDRLRRCHRHRPRRASPATPIPG